MADTHSTSHGYIHIFAPEAVKVSRSSDHPDQMIIALDSGWVLFATAEAALSMAGQLLRVANEPDNVVELKPGARCLTFKTDSGDAA